MIHVTTRSFRRCNPGRRRVVAVTAMAMLGVWTWGGCAGPSVSTGKDKMMAEPAPMDRMAEYSLVPVVLLYDDHAALKRRLRMTLSAVQACLEEKHPTGRVDPPDMDELRVTMRTNTPAATVANGDRRLVVTAELVLESPPEPRGRVSVSARVLGYRALVDRELDIQVKDRNDAAFEWERRLRRDMTECCENAFDEVRAAKRDEERRDG